MTPSELRRRIAQAVADDWTPGEPPGTVPRHPAHRRCWLPAAHLRPPDALTTRRKGEVPDAESMVLSLLPWADNDRYRELLRWDLPPQPSSPPLLPF